MKHLNKQNQLKNRTFTKNSEKYLQSLQKRKIREFQFRTQRRMMQKQQIDEDRITQLTRLNDSKKKMIQKFQKEQLIREKKSYHEQFV